MNSLVSIKDKINENIDRYLFQVSLSVLKDQLQININLSL